MQVVAISREMACYYYELSVFILQKKYGLKAFINAKLYLCSNAYYLEKISFMFETSTHVIKYRCK